MSGFGSGFDDVPVYQAPVSNKKGKAVGGYQKPPYAILGIGFLLSPLSSLLLLVSPPTGSNTIFVGFLLWIVGLASYFVPFAMFTLSDLAKQANLMYAPNPKKSAGMRRLLLVVGSIFLVFPTYYLASSLASWVTVILG